MFIGNGVYEKLNASIQRLDQWLDNNGWAGYDPYDIKELKWVRKLTYIGNKNPLYEVVRETVFELFYTFPHFSRKIFRVKPRINAKAIALFSKSYLDLYKISMEKSYLNKSEYCLNWLLENKITKYRGIAWGYPFDWQTTELIPKYTPNGIVTTAAGDAFWSWYQFTKEDKYLKTCEEICKFLISLPIDRIEKNQLCFSYTPVFINHVHNLNLFVAEFLIKIGKETGNDKWILLGTKAVNYTISNQLDNGAFDYNGPPEKSRNFSDNYHTGFVLRMLHSIWELTGNQKVLNSLTKCYEHYINNFFEEEKIPKLLPNRKYRIDIHSCAESINCLSQLSGTFPEGLKIAENVAKWTIDNLQSPEGYFYYGFIKSRFIRKPFLSKIPYIRWGQAWMLKGLTNLLLNA
ncbi:MAG: hypothetical protein H8D45_28985 [Bacteroidetes bacterium]|nr:hypothetical protein [Bacteroidota bacterium]MBL7136186.1 hypothetical protein [Candidatus Neomarinimicrobiota bacterium]